MTRRLVLALTLAALGAGIAVSPGAGAQTPPKKQPETPLAQAREESSVKNRPPSRHDLPAGELRLSASELLAASQSTLELSVTLDRAVERGTLEVTLPARWLARSAVSGLPFASVPERGRGSGGRAARSSRVVSFEFDGAKTGASARFELEDVGIPAGTYELPFRWREPGRDAKGTATVIFYAPVREAQNPSSGWERLSNPAEINVTNDAVNESETFITMVPGNEKRFIVGANGGGSYSAWVTNDGQTFTKAVMPATTDAPGEAGPETSALCCDPMSAADEAGNLWYGGLSFPNGAGQPSRIVVNRIAPGQTSFQPQTVGLAQRTSGTQDKPMMTIDNSPASPTYGRLYVVWNEPASGGGINIVISQCDTRASGALDAAHCDNADNWTAPVSVTPATGSYIYADVAVGPAGQVYVVWWNYSSANNISGRVCTPPSQNCATAAGWSANTVKTIATLDKTGGQPIPFACPIVAQPGGRASTSPQVDVDRSGGANHGRVYVTWSDLRTGSGTTRCRDGGGPLPSHLSFDSFVASANGALPGSANPSPDVATRLIADGERLGQANSDDWFAWLAVDQTTGQAWADLYSTRDDPTRRTTHLYLRSVTPSGGSGHTLGTLLRASLAPSDYSTAPCCGFGNDYGDYTGIDATNGVAIPVWSDKREADGEAFVAYPTPRPQVVGLETAIDDTAGGDGDGVVEPGESFEVRQSIGNSGSASATSVSGTLTESRDDLTLPQASSGYPAIEPGAGVDNASPFVATLASEAPCGAPLSMMLDVTTAQGEFAIPLTVPTGTLNTAPFTTAPAAAIPDNDPAGLTSELAVSGVGEIADVDVRVNATHTWIGDLIINVTAPDGTSVRLFTQRGREGDNLSGTIFDDEADVHIASGGAPFTGRFRPEQPLSILDGINGDGTWSLRVIDTYADDTGTLNSWGVDSGRFDCEVTTPPPPPEPTPTPAPQPTATPAPTATPTPTPVNPVAIDLSTAPRVLRVPRSRKTSYAFRAFGAQEGTLKIRSRKRYRVKRGAKKRKVTFVRSQFLITADGKVIVSKRVSKKAMRVLRRAKRVKSVAIVKVGDTTAKRTVIMRARR